MKCRTGFVSNSSSASFVVKKKFLTEFQLKAIRNHFDFATQFLRWDNKYLTKGEAWELTENDDEIFGGTGMDNFDMREFLEQINVSEKDYKFYEN